MIVDYKDDVTAFNGLKKGTIVGKGIINNRMRNLLMKWLEKKGIPTHFVKELSDREALVKKVTIVPLEEQRLSDKKYGSTKQGIAPFYSDKYQKKSNRKPDDVSCQARRQPSRTPRNHP